MIEKIKELLAKQLRLDVNNIEDDANILDDLGADSLEVVEMLMTLESEFGIVVPDEDVMSLKTVRAVAEYIESHTNNSSVPLPDAWQWCFFPRLQDRQSQSHRFLPF